MPHRVSWRSFLGCSNTIWGRLGSEEIDGGQRDHLGGVDQVLDRDVLVASVEVRGGRHARGWSEMNRFDAVLEEEPRIGKRGAPKQLGNLANHLSRTTLQALHQ